MMNSESINITAIDLSYRDTGFAKLSLCDYLEIKESSSIKNPKIELMGFKGLPKIVDNVHNALGIASYKSGLNTIIIIEIPCMSQTAKDAILMGMLWSSAKVQFPNAIIIQPQILKLWSESKAGDGKDKVKEKVISRCQLPPKSLSNNNIVDAVGIGLMFFDLIKLCKHEATK